MFHDMGIGFMGIGWLLWLIIIGTITYLIMRIVNQKQLKKSSPVSNDIPIEILKKRFASGEISEEEFFRIKRSIT